MPVRKTFKLLSVGVCVIVGTLSFNAPATAVPQASATGVIASYKGAKIDLSRGWSDAQVCVVYSATDTRCYASSDEANEAVAKQAASGVSRADGSVVPLATWNGCPDDWFCLYEHSNFGGRRLQFMDENWQSLIPYDFANKTSSVTNNQNNGFPFGCEDSAELGAGGGFNLYVPDCTATAALGGGWNDIADDTHG